MIIKVLAETCKETEIHNPGTAGNRPHSFTVWRFEAWSLILNFHAFPDLNYNLNVLLMLFSSVMYIANKR